MTSLQVLGEEECLRLLRSATLGRLGFSARSLPVVLPVNYVVDGDRLVFATEASSILAAAINSDVACLEIDDHDVLDHTGWSVLVTGQLRELSTVEAQEATRDQPLPLWRAMPSPQVVELSIDMVSGRRLATV